MSENTKNSKTIKSTGISYKQVGHVVDEHAFFFRKLCEYIADDVKEQLPIREDVLLNFNKTVVALMENNFIGGITSFEKLSSLISEYMRYGLEDDNSKQRIYSYVRLSQMIDTFKAFQEERSIEIKAHQEASEHPEYAKVIRELKHSRRVTYKLSLDIDKSKNGSLMDLMIKGFVIKGGTQNDNYFILSRTGDALFRNLCFDGDYDWVDQWSVKRILVLTYLLLQLSRFKSDIMVKDIAMIMSEHSEKHIDAIYKRVILNDNIKVTPSFSANNALKSTISDSHIDEDNIPNLMDVNNDSLENIFSSCRNRTIKGKNIWKGKCERGLTISLR